MTARLTVTGFLAVLACTAALASTALAEDSEGLPPDEAVTSPDEGGWEGELVDPVPEGEGTIEDDSVIYETGVVDGEDGEPVEYLEDGGEVVAYGPDDCIDCNVAPTTVFDGEGRGVAENQRGGAGVDAGGAAMARDSGGSGRPSCGSLKAHDMRPCDN